MKACKKCSATYEDSFDFCPVCGETLTPAARPFPWRTVIAAVCVLAAFLVIRSSFRESSQIQTQRESMAQQRSIRAAPGKPKKKKFLLLAIPVLAVLALLVVLFQNGTLGASSAKANQAILGHWECDTLYLNEDGYDASRLGGISCDVSGGSLTVTHGLSYFDDLTLYWKINDDPDSAFPNADYRYSLLASPGGTMLGVGAVDGNTFYLALLTSGDNLMLYEFSRG